MKNNEQYHKNKHIDIDANKRFFKIQICHFPKRKLGENDNKCNIQNKNGYKKDQRYFL